jgi:hypothetical protein
MYSTAAPPNVGTASWTYQAHLGQLADADEPNRNRVNWCVLTRRETEGAAVTSEPERDERYWRGHPMRALLLRVAVFTVPLLVSIATGVVVSHLLPTPGTTYHIVLWWGLVLATSTVSVYLSDREARRLLPLATLLRLSMLFPDRAPSRLRVVRRVAVKRTPRAS